MQFMNQLCLGPYLDYIRPGHILTSGVPSSSPLYMDTFMEKSPGWPIPSVVASVTKPASAVQKATAAMSFLFVFLSLS